MGWRHLAPNRELTPTIRGRLRSSAQTIQYRQLLMWFLQISRDQVQIPHRRRDLGVSEDSRQPDHVSAVLQVAGRERVAEPMESRLRNLNAPQKAIVGSERVPLTEFRSRTGRKEPIGGPSLAVRQLLPAE